MLAAIPTASVLGVEGKPVTVEVHVSAGLPGFTVVGLPDASCREARDRVRAALLSSGLVWPMRRITVNLAPAGVRKAGAGFDLAIAIGVLVAGCELAAEAVVDTGFIGELGLDGSIRPVPGVVSLVDAIQATTVVLPQQCQAEGALVKRCKVRGATNLGQLVANLRGEQEWVEALPSAPSCSPMPEPPDLADVRGQAFACLAAEIAAAGAHHLLLVGPPGAGKTMLAQRLVGLLPALQEQEALEVTRVHSAAGLGLPASGLIDLPPLRAPHHGVSMVAMIGGGSSVLRPGEISLAHRGVLFLDELGEFPPAVLDALRQPLEEGVVRVSRAHASATLPAQFLLVAASNPCPCGAEGVFVDPCRCSDAARQRYARRLSGPLLDRFDVRLGMSRPMVDDLFESRVGESSAVVGQRVALARSIALQRQGCLNAALGPPGLRLHAGLVPAARDVLVHALKSGHLSARGLHRVQRVARTIADLAGHGAVAFEDVSLALQLRNGLSPERGAR